MDKHHYFETKDEDFKKSSWSKNNPKTCVLIAKKQEGVAVRDSKDNSQRTLYFTHEEWTAFTRAVKANEF